MICVDKRLLFRLFMITLVVRFRHRPRFFKCYILLNVFNFIPPKSLCPVWAIWSVLSLHSAFPNSKFLKILWCLCISWILLWRTSLVLVFEPFPLFLNKHGLSIIRGPFKLTTALLLRYIRIGLCKPHILRTLSPLDFCLKEYLLKQSLIKILPLLK